jgi:hypothetical protein
MFVTHGSKNSLCFVFASLSNLDCGQWYKFWICQSHPMSAPATQSVDSRQECLFRKVTSVSIHSFVEWLDTFAYVLRPADVTVKEVNHIRCFAVDIAKYLILLSCRLVMEHNCVLQLETALATLVTTWFTLADCRWRSRYRSSDQCILNVLCRWNATTDGSGNNLASVSLFSISFQWWRTMPKFFSKEGW